MTDLCDAIFGRGATFFLSYAERVWLARTTFQISGGFDGMRFESHAQTLADCAENRSEIVHVRVALR